MFAASYHHADYCISYIAGITDCQFFQMYASVNTKTMINFPHNHTQTFAFHVQDRPLHFDMQVC